MDSHSESTEITTILATEDLLKERQTTHGHYSDHAKITQDLKDVMHLSFGWDCLTVTQKESLEMIVHKIGRILAGNPNHADHWDDIAGYAKLWNYSANTRTEERLATSTEIKSLPATRSGADLIMPPSEFSKLSDMQ